MILVFSLFVAAALQAQTIETLIGAGRPGFTATSVNNPYGLVIGPDRALYFCDIDNHAVRRLDLNTRKVTTLFESPGSQPYEIRFDKKGNLLFVDMPKHTVLRIDRRTRAVSVVAGTGQPGFSGDGGPATQAQLRQPHSIAFDRQGRLLICDIGNHRVRRVDLDTGRIETYLGTGERKPTPDGAPIEGTPFNGPRALDIDPQGNLYLALREGNAVYRIDPRANRVTHVAGNGSKGLAGDGGPATAAALNGPKGVALSKAVLYLADTENHAIRAIHLKTGVISTVAGTGERGDGPDGDPARCKLNRPHGVFVSREGTLYIADSESHRIRVIKGVK